MKRDIRHRLFERYNQKMAQMEEVGKKVEEQMTTISFEKVFSKLKEDTNSNETG